MSQIPASFFQVRKILDLVSGSRPVLSLSLFKRFAVECMYFSLDSVPDEQLTLDGSVDG